MIYILIHFWIVLFIAKLCRQPTIFCLLELIETTSAMEPTTLWTILITACCMCLLNETLSDSYAKCCKILITACCMCLLNETLSDIYAKSSNFFKCSRMKTMQNKPLLFLSKIGLFVI